MFVCVHISIYPAHLVRACNVWSYIQDSNPITLALSTYRCSSAPMNGPSLVIGASRGIHQAQAFSSSQPGSTASEEDCAIETLGMMPSQCIPDPGRRCGPRYVIQLGVTRIHEPARRGMNRGTLNGELSRKHANCRSRTLPAPKSGLLKPSFPLRLPQHRGNTFSHLSPRVCVRSVLASLDPSPVIPATTSRPTLQSSVAWRDPRAAASAIHNTKNRRSSAIWTPCFKVPYKAIEAMRVGDYLDDSWGSGRNTRHRGCNAACVERVHREGEGLVPRSLDFFEYHPRTVFFLVALGWRFQNLSVRTGRQRQMHRVSLPSRNQGEKAGR